MTNHARISVKPTHLTSATLALILVASTTATATPSPATALEANTQVDVHVESSNYEASLDDGADIGVTDEVYALLPRGGRGAITESDIARATEEFWTEERMDAAEAETPAAPEPIRESSTLSHDVTPKVTVRHKRVVSHPVAPTETLFTANRLPRKQWVNGRLYSVNSKNELRTCSASAVNSPSKQLISTAAHCVYDFPARKYKKNIVFRAGFNGRDMVPLKFSVKKAGTLPGFRRHGPTTQGHWSDVAFAKTRTNWGGKKVVEAVGGHGMVLPYSDETYKVSIFGYPNNIRSGAYQSTCHNSATPLDVEDKKGRLWRYALVEGCGFGEGSSGSPLLVDYDKQTGRGYIAAIVSHGPEEGYPTWLRGLHFRNDAYKKYKWVDAQ